LACLLPLNVFDGVLWGSERFDLLNRIRIPADLIRGSLSAIVVAYDGGLIALAVVTLAVTLLGGLARAAAAMRVAPDLRLRVQHVAPHRIRELFSFGIWNSIRSVATMIPSKFTPLLVGVLVGVAQVTALSIAARLLACASAILVAASGVITPVATALHARDATSRQEQLLLDGGKYGLAAAGLFLALFVMLGKPLICLWVGPDFEVAYPLLVVLAMGRFVSMSQVVTRSVITAQAKHKMLAAASIVQGAGTVVLAPVVIGSSGIVGVCIGVGVMDALCEGLFSLMYGCRLTGTPVRQYAQRVVAPTLLATAVPCALLAAVVSWRPVGGWLDLILYGTAFVAVYLGSVVVVFERPDLRWKRLQGDPSRCGI
jgi:O-antigen/teichoic acid export membrane protein